MRKLYDEPRTVRLYLLITVLFSLLTLLIAWACSLLERLTGLAVMWACGCAMAVLASYITWRHSLRGLKWPCRHLSIEAPLLVSSAYQVHHAQFPKTLTVAARINAGSSALLLSACAMLTLPERGRSAAQQAVMDFLAPLKPDQAGFLRKHPLVGHRSDGTLDWAVCQDGEGLRAYTSGDARDVLAACDFIWLGEKVPLTDEDREELLAVWAGEELPATGFAMADLTGGVPSEPVFLGAMLMEHALLPFARHEADRLRRHGYSISLLGLGEHANERIGALLNCREPEEGEQILTLACTSRITGPNLYQVPATVTPTRAIGYLKTLYRRLSYQPIQLGLMLTAAAILCAVTGLRSTALALSFVLLLAQTAFAPVMPRPLPRINRDRVITGAVCMLTAIPLFGWLTGWFIGMTGAEPARAALMYLLPVMMLLGVQSARLSSTAKPVSTLPAVLVYAVCLVTMAVAGGCDLLSGAFTFVAGTLAAVMLQSLLQYADRR